jgi:hypothetical protein
MVRKKILLLCDDIRVHSGIGNVGRNIVTFTSNKYDWVNLGGAIKHPESGKKIDISEYVNKKLNIDNSSVVIYPNDGYGNPELIRQLMDIEKPDALFLITDPRYWVWLFQIENEIRKQCPIVYLNIWDNYPIPFYNKPYYESCDMLLGISKQTVLINREVLGKKGENKIIRYIPHGVDDKIFYPLSDEDKLNLEFLKFKKELFRNKNYDFCVFFNSRNVGRKRISDTIVSFKKFIDLLPEESAKKCVLVLHTQTKDLNGTDLESVINYFDNGNLNVIITDSILSEIQLNWLYNIADLQILLSSNEGWGLSLTEAILTGTPILANVTGGMQDQMGFEDENGEWYTPSLNVLSNNMRTYSKCGDWVFPVYPKVSTIEGSIQTPYIYNDICSQDDVAEKLLEAYNLGKEELKRRGNLGREWAMNKDVGFTSEIMANRITDALDELFGKWEPREKYELILI